MAAATRSGRRGIRREFGTDRRLIVIRSSRFGSLGPPSPIIGMPTLPILAGVRERLSCIRPFRTQPLATMYRFQRRGKHLCLEFQQRLLCTLKTETANGSAARRVTCHRPAAPRRREAAVREEPLLAGRPANGV